MAGYTRARSDWISIGQPGQTLVRESDMDHIEQAIYELKRFGKNPMDYGAAGDGAANDYQAVTDAYTDAPNGGALVLPGDKCFKSNSQLVFDRRVSVIGQGIGSALKVNVGTSTDGVVFGTTSLNYGVVLQNFAVLGDASSCRYAAVFRNLVHSSIDNVYIKAGTVAATGYGASIEGCLINRFRLVLPGTNATFPYSATENVNGVRVVGSAGWPSGGNELDLIIEAIAGDGLVVDATIGTAGDFNNWIRGVYEGIVGKGVWLTSCKEFSLHDAHLEGVNVGENTLRLDGCQRGQVGSGVFASRRTELVNCVDIVLDGLTTDILSIDNTNNRIEERRVVWGIQGGTRTNNSTNTLASNTFEQPRARVYRTTNKAITTAVQTAIDFDAERFDTDAIHSTVSNTTRLTCNTAGPYRITGNLAWANASAAGTRGCYIVLNGATIIGAEQDDDNTAVGRIQNVVTTYDLSVGDYVELQAYQTSGGNLNVSAAGNYSPEFMMERLP